MATVRLSEIQRDLPAYIRRVAAGENFVITEEGRPVAEIKPVTPRPTAPRPSGLCRGAFRVPDDFDAPLPEEVIREFEGT